MVLEILHDKRGIRKENIGAQIEYNQTIKISEYLYGREIQRKLYEFVGFFDGPGNSHLVVYNVIDVNRIALNEIIDICNYRDIPLDNINYLMVAKALYCEDCATDDIYQFDTKEEAIEFARKELAFEI